MAKIDISKIETIHFIGIGGIGMSALARLLKFDKKTVSGSDIQDSALLQALEQEGMQIFRAQVAENIPDEVDLIVYTEALHDDNPELVAARARKVPVINYFEALALCVNPYYLIAVAGTHGKTTTTAMLTDVFEATEKDPTAIIGSLRASTKSNYRPGKSKYAIVEACEYKRDYLHLTPDVLVILNLEHEHVDYYKDLADVQAAFREFIERVHETGYVVTNTSDPNIKPIIENCPVPVVDYKEFTDLMMPMKQPGMHNRFNAAAALAVARREKLAMEKAKQALSEYAGTWRRFEYKGEVNGAVVYDDYAHHPTEIAATIAGTKELYPDKALTVIFQPHTYSRTKGFFREIAKSFKGAQHVILLPIYAAREENTGTVSSRELAVATLEYCRDSQFVGTFEDAEAQVRAMVGSDDVVVVMGAGDVTHIASNLTK